MNVRLAIQPWWLLRMDDSDADGTLHAHARTEATGDVCTQYVSPLGPWPAIREPRASHT